MTTADKVRKIIAEELDIKLKKITDAAEFQKDFGADSLDTIQITMALEDKFDIKISDEDAEKLITVKQVIKYIEKEVQHVSRR